MTYKLTLAKPDDIFFPERGNTIYLEDVAYITSTATTYYFYDIDHIPLYFGDKENIIEWGVVVQ